MLRKPFQRVGGERGGGVEAAADDQSEVAHDLEVGAGSPSIRIRMSAFTIPGRGFSLISIMLFSRSRPISRCIALTRARSGECSGVYSAAWVGSLYIDHFFSGIPSIARVSTAGTTL